MLLAIFSSFLGHESARLSFFKENQSILIENTLASSGIIIIVYAKIMNGNFCYVHKCVIRDFMVFYIIILPHFFYFIIGKKIVLCLLP